MKTNSAFSCRHKRTHDRGEGEGGFSLSGEEEEDYSGEDHLGSLDDASPTSETGYVTASLNSVATGNSHNTSPTSNGMTPSAAAAAVAAATTMAQAPSFNSLQTLSMPMTMSQPQAINAGVMM